MVDFRDAEPSKSANGLGKCKVHGESEEDISEMLRNEGMCNRRDSCKCDSELKHGLQRKLRLTARQGNI